jgi:RNA polymerase sigma-70 factor (ECF subfamily)
VWLRAFRNRTNFDLQYPDARPWLYGIARNVLIAHWRHSTKTPPSLPVAITDPWPEVDARLDGTARREELIAALDVLSIEEREALLLVAWEQLNATEIGLMLNVPASTVRNRLHRARTAIRVGLGSDFFLAWEKES